MTLKRYLFLLVCVLILVLGIVQVYLAFILKEQASAEVEQRSKQVGLGTLDFVINEWKNNSEQRQRLTQKVVTTNKSMDIEIIAIPNKVIALDDEFAFETGDSAYEVIYQPNNSVDPTQIIKQLKQRVENLNVHALQTGNAFTIIDERQGQLTQQIVNVPENVSVVETLFDDLLWIIVVLVVLGFILAYWLAHHVSLPLTNISHGFEKLRHQLGTQVDVQGVGEIRQMAERFNATSNQLKYLQEQAQRLQADQHTFEISEVIRGLAHSIRNPINTVGLTADKLAQDTLSPEQRQKYVDDIQEKLALADRTIKNVLRFSVSGIDRDQKIIINSVIQDVMLEFLSSNDVPISLAAPSKLSTIGNESELRAIIHSVVSNAVEASHHKCPVDIALFSQQGEIIITVSDKGDGIAPDIQDKLFQPHVTTKPEGTGMGLYLAQRLCHSSFNGNISVESNSETGTQVRINLGKCDE
jgi:signal transduction histidine kinase